MTKQELQNQINKLQEELDKIKDAIKSRKAGEKKYFSVFQPFGI